MQTDLIVEREKRLWVRDRSTLELITSAKLDVFYILGTHALIIDAKSGFRTPTPSERNWQLKCQVVALWQAHPELEHIRAATAHSRLSSSFDATDYDIEDIKRAEREIRQVIWRSQQPEAPRVPGAHCRYCRALGVCREAATHSLVVAHGGKLLPTGKPDQLAIIESVGRMTPGELAFVHKKEPLAKAFFDSVEARMKQLPEDVLAGIGYRLADGNRLRNIIDPATAFARLDGEFKADRLAGLKLTVGRIADAHAERTGISKKEATEKIYAAMGDVVVEKEGNKRLKAL